MNLTHSQVRPRDAKLPPDESAGRFSTGALIVVAIVTLIVFAPLCGHEFTWWDDPGTIHQNEWLKQPAWVGIKHYWTSFALGLYIPFTYTVWILLAMIARVRVAEPHGITLNPWVYHSTSVALHVISAILAFLILRRLVKKDLAACLGAILFAVHPVQVESVGWISGMKDVLAGCFGLAAILRYIIRAQANRGNEWWPDALGTVALLAAILSKPSACMVPPIAVCIDKLILNRPWKTVLRASAVWFAIMTPLLLVARLAQVVGDLIPTPIWARPLIAGDSYAFYLYKLILPIHLAMDYGRRPAIVMQHWWFWANWLVPAIVALAIWRSRKPWLIAAGAVFVLAILPVSGLATFEFQFATTTADHYLYLAMLGPAIALAYFIREFDYVILRAIVAAALLLLAGRAFVQTGVWKDDLALFDNAIRVNPYSFVAHNNMGCAFEYVAKDAEALEQYRVATRLNTEYTTAYNNLANLLIKRGEIEESITVIEDFIRIQERQKTLTPNTNYLEDHNRIGQVLLKRGEYARAIAHFEALLAKKPEHAEAKKFLKEAREKQREAATRPTTKPTTAP